MTRFSFHVLSGISAITCRQAVAIRCMSLIRKSARELQKGKTLKFFRSICTERRIRDTIILSNGAEVVVSQQRRIMNIARSAG